MICKEVNYKLAIDEWEAQLRGGRLSRRKKDYARMQVAGLRAEANMAYFLGIHFAENKQFRIFNNLKVEHDGRSAQIDHLVLTRWTAYFVESKSVSQKITVNEYGEWGRIYGRKYSEMESPVEQSKRHELVLYDFLNAHRGEFMGKLLGLVQKGFRKLLTAQHYVAVSPKGQIGGKGRADFPQVIKADLVPGRIREYHDRLDTGLLSKSFRKEDFDAFNPKEFDAVTEFLLANDKALTPLQQAQLEIQDIDRESEAAFQHERDATSEELSSTPAQAKVPPKPVSPSVSMSCRKCGSDDLRIVHGPYGYYFKCEACEGNTPIKETCPACGSQTKVSKSKQEFFLVCGDCQARSLYWTNR